MNNIAAGAPLQVLATQTTPVERVPSIANLDGLPDMGRMTARWP